MIIDITLLCKESKKEVLTGNSLVMEAKVKVTWT